MQALEEAEKEPAALSDEMAMLGMGLGDDVAAVDTWLNN